MAGSEDVFGAGSAAEFPAHSPLVAAEAPTSPRQSNPTMKVR